MSDVSAAPVITTLCGKCNGLAEKVIPRAGLPFRYRRRWACFARSDMVGFLLRVHSCTTSLRISCRIGRRCIKQPLALRNSVVLVRRVSIGGSKKPGMEGVKAGGNLSMPHFKRTNSMMCCFMSRVTL